MSEFETGCVYGRLTVIGVGEQYVSPKGRRVSRWKCECVCGNIVDVVPSKLRSGHTSSCGCLLREKITQHGHNRPGKRTPTYRAYDNMRGRCYNPNATGYKDYGAIGISVCDRWMEPAPQGFLNFLEDMGEKLEGSMLDRIDVMGNYTPENCRWTDRRTSNYNTAISKANKSGRVGVYKESRTGKWVATARINGPKIDLYRGDSFDDAVKAREAFEISEWGELKKYSTPEELDEVRNGQ